MRIKRGVAAHKRHKKLLKSVKGYKGRNRTTIRTAKQAQMKAGLHAYRDRKLKKRSYRALWIVRLNAAVRAKGSTYSKFMYAMNQKGVVLNRKALSELAVNDPASFDLFVNQVLSPGEVTRPTSTGKTFAAPELRKRVERTPEEVEEKAAAKKASAKKSAPAKKTAAKKATAKSAPAAAKKTAAKKGAAKKTAKK